MSKIQEVTVEEDFKSITSSTSSNTLLVISFHTPWAAPCAQMRTLLETLASTYQATTPPTITFLSIDAEELPEISESYDVTAVPFLVLQRDGKVLETISGCDATKVREAVERHASKNDQTAGKKRIPEALTTTPRTETNGSNVVHPTNDLASYAPDSSDPPTAPKMSEAYVNGGATDTEALNKRLEGLVKAAPVMLFMKGTPSSPQCGFSRQLVGILRENGVRYGFFNILADDEVRQGLKVWADWPTFPQLWVGGELVGGLDIVKEELEGDPEFFKDYSVVKGKGGMAAPEAQKQPGLVEA